MKAVAVYEALPPDSKRFMKHRQDRGGSSWVNIIPFEDEGFNARVNKDEFFHSLRIRYNLPLPLLPVTCVCGQPNNLAQALQCQKGGFVKFVDKAWPCYRIHDNIRAFLICLLKEFCVSVSPTGPVTRYPLHGTRYIVSVKLHLSL